MTKAAIYTDKPVLAEGLRTVVTIMQGFALTAVYPNEDSMVDHIRRNGCPDLVVVEETAATTLAALSQLMSIAPTAAFVLWAETASSEFAQKARQLGVFGILPKRASIERHFEFFSAVAARSAVRRGGALKIAGPNVPAGCVAGAAAAEVACHPMYLV